MSSTRIFLKFLLLVATLLLIGWLLSPLSACALGAIIGLCAWAYSNFKLVALQRWLSNVPGAKVPGGLGLWDEVFSLLYRQNRAQSHQVQVLTHALVAFRRAAQALPDGVITLSPENHILWCNENAVHMFGLNLALDTGRSLSNLVRVPEFQDYLLKADWSKTATFRLAQAEPKWYAVRMVEYGEGERLLLARDVTQLERLDTMRRDFVANVSHELKTPLTVLAGFLETIQMHAELPASQLEHFFDLMNQQTLRMKRLVEDLLTLSALESGAQVSSETKIKMTGFMQRLQAAAEQLDQQKHRLSFDLQPGITLLGNEIELASAFENLISNAIRYTPPGGSISVRLKIEGEGPTPQMRFSVSDTGIGIEAQHLPRLTERFYRVDRGRSRETGGTGLGLAIVKHVLTRHEANLLIDSEYGKGTTMTALFPAQRFQVQ